MFSVSCGTEDRYDEVFNSELLEAKNLDGVAFEVTQETGASFKRILSSDSRNFSINSKVCYLEYGSKIQFKSSPIYTIGYPEEFHGTIVSGLNPNCQFNSGYINKNEIKKISPFFNKTLKSVNVRVKTDLKKHLRHNIALNDQEKCKVYPGSVHFAETNPKYVMNGYYKVTLTSVNNCNFKEGYLYGPHVWWEPSYKTTITSKNTVLKARIASSSELAANEQTSLPAGNYQLLSEPVYVKDGHFLVRFKSFPGNSSIKSGFVYGPHIGLTPLAQPIGKVKVLSSSTIFKAKIAQSNNLSSEQKCELKAGSEVVLLNQPVFVKDKHFAVSLLNTTSPCSFINGYVYGPQFELQVPEKPTRLLYKAIGDTYLKDSVESTKEKCLITRGTEVGFKREPVFAGAQHFEVELAYGAGNCKREGFIYGPHFGIEVPKPGGYAVKNKVRTLIKIRNTSSQLLGVSEKCEIPENSTFWLSQKYTYAGLGHFQGKLNYPIKGCSLKKGSHIYFFGPHSGITPPKETDIVVDEKPVDPRKPIPSTKGNTIKTDSYCQCVNYKWGGSTCNYTALSMAFSAFNKKVHPETLINKMPVYDTSKSGRPAYRLYIQNLAKIAKRYGFNRSYASYSGTVSKIKNEIDSGNPVILGTYFTGGSGHFVLVVGYDSKGFIINDPAGKWVGRKYGGYPSGFKCTSNSDRRGYNNHWSYAKIKHTSTDKWDKVGKTYWIVVIKK